MQKIKLTLRYLYELYYRLTHILIGITFFFVINYNYKQTIVYIILPQGITHFITTNITEIFINYIQLCVIVSLFITAIVLIIQLYLFLRPGLYLYESKRYFRFLLFTISIYICIYFKIYPTLIQMLWEFFLYYMENFNSLQLNFEPKFTDYINYMQTLAITLIIIYPIIIVISFILKRINLIIITKYRSISYLTILLIATLITPPDPFSQILLSLIINFFYEGGIFIRILNSCYLPIPIS